MTNTAFSAKIEQVQFAEQIAQNVTPTHGLWLNLIESFFSKMSKQMLKGIRVNTKEELSDRVVVWYVRSCHYERRVASRSVFPGLSM